MVKQKPTTPIADNPLVRALSRWENEGGSSESEWAKRAALVEEEEHILHCLGTAVLVRWNTLPTEIKREIYASAVSLGKPLERDELKLHVARFLHSHKDLKQA